VAKNKLVNFLIFFNNNKTYIVIPRKASWFIAVQASKVREKLPFDFILLNNSAFIRLTWFI
jgi:hypothetical protein